MTGFLLTLLGAGLACGLEVLETVMIVLAIGVERGWRDTLVGVFAGLAVLVAGLALLGPVVLGLGEDVLHLLIGATLLWFGGQWLRKGVLRLAGRKAPSSAAREYLESRAAARELAPARPGRADWPARVLAGKSVLIEGIEVALIVVALGAERMLPTLLGAGLGMVVVLVCAYAARGALLRLPESQLKYGVGVVLVSFGIFFLGEGLGLEWPLGDVALLGVAALVVAVSQLSIERLARVVPS